MSKVLYIKANIKQPGESRTFKISNNFIDEYKQKNPKDDIFTLDLYNEDIGFLQSKDLQTIYGPKTEESKKHPILKYAYQFAEADKYVVAVPMWNLSFPAILKAYMDYISITGITFKYTATGPVGLCQGKKAVYITTRGGEYKHGAAAELEMGERYIKALFAFYGIKDFQCISAENLDVMGADVNSILKETIDKAIKIADQF